MLRNIRTASDKLILLFLAKSLAGWYISSGINSILLFGLLDGLSFIARMIHLKGTLVNTLLHERRVNVGLGGYSLFTLCLCHLDNSGHSELKTAPCKPHGVLVICWAIVACLVGCFYLNNSAKQ